MRKRSYLKYGMLMLAISTPLNNNSYAACGPCTTEQTQKGCKNVNISYERVFDKDADWKADMWYTPCDATTESTFYANDWNENLCCVKKDSQIRIGQMGTVNTFIDQKVGDADFHAICSGFVGDISPFCRDASKPLPACTELTVAYDQGVTWLGTMDATPCGRSDTGRVNLHQKSQTFSVASGTNASIVVFLGINPLVDEVISGKTAKIQCSGTLVGDSSCCLVGTPNCTPKASKKKKKGK